VNLETGGASPSLGAKNTITIRTNMHTITITKIDHDDYLGYYIDDGYYAYVEYNSITDDEVKLEAIVQAFEAGHIKHRSDVNFVMVEKYDLPGFSYEADEELINRMPNTCTELRAHFANYNN
jgi:hypothetical protein